MAYTATVTVTRPGNGDYQITINETDCGPTSEAVITGVPVEGTVRRQMCILNSGTAATINPVLGTQTNPVGTPYVAVQNLTAAALVDTQGAATYTTPGSPTLYHRSQPNAGTDNVVQTVYHISLGW